MGSSLDVVDERAIQKHLRKLNIVGGEPITNKCVDAELRNTQPATAELSDSQLIDADQCDSASIEHHDELSDSDLLDAERTSRRDTGGVRGCSMVGECERGAGARADAANSSTASKCVALPNTTSSGNNPTTPTLPAANEPAISADLKQQASSSCQTGPTPKPFPKLCNFKWVPAKVASPPAKPTRSAYKRQLAIDETAPKSTPIDINNPTLMWSNNKPQQLIRTPARATGRKYGDRATSTNNSDSAPSASKRRRSGKQQHDSA
ncbi:MAG: hypothetical protein FD143_3308 [Ignavibacteria bacterium]|nr:MAG: hypothetical protein FD143_3308 [Ignavibacteria bacterium]